MHLASARPRAYARTFTGARVVAGVSLAYARGRFEWMRGIGVSNWPILDGRFAGPIFDRAKSDELSSIPGNASVESAPDSKASLK